MEVGKITHSHSQPGGMDRTPPGTPKKGGKMLAVRVQMLDDTITMFQVQAKALGRVLFDQVCNQLHLLESDYFGLEYQETGGTKYWLDLEKPLSRQIGLSLVDTLVRFCVKFYTPDPSQLEEEFTRYLFCLQIKRDLSQGLLQCNNNTAALMASYIVQAECGDYVVEDYPDHRYLSSYKFVPNQDQELERRIMENHKKHAGQSPAEADLNLLETARRCELYGIKMHPAKDHEGVPLNLAVAHMGIVVFQNYSKINTFSWAKIRKISFKRKRFLVKLHPEGYGYYKDTVEFFFDGRNECKNFWKKCVENHGFFRCTMVKKVPRQKTRVLSRGSSFRYSGRTQKQIVDFVRENYVKRQTFQRSQSFRHSSSTHSSVANVGTSISAHPLLPLGDNAVAGTPASLSCGSMTLTSSPVHTADIHAGGSPSPPLTTSVSPGTSVTSSPQHFYPQETPYRRAGHQPTTMKHPHVHSHRAISPLHSPTDAAVAASSRSANLSNNNNNNINNSASNNNINNDNNAANNNNNNNTILSRNDVMSPQNALHSPEFTDFNEVYSNCYSYLKSSRSNVDKESSDNGAKPDMFNFPSNFISTASKSNESIKSLANKSKHISSRGEDAEKYTWHRSASCKDLYCEENESTNGKNWAKRSQVPFPMGVECDHSKRKCYSAATSQNPSVDRTGDALNEVMIYPSGYPCTTSSLSTDSAEGELEERIIDVLDLKYDSQEEMALSHDDVSHDSYELLERELEGYSQNIPRHKSDRVIHESERTRSCSWGSERGISPMDFRSTENVISSGHTFSQEQSFWSLERRKNSKHKSEVDFRSFGHKGSKGVKRSSMIDNRWKMDEKDLDRAGKPPEVFDRENMPLKKNWELEEDIFEYQLRGQEYRPPRQSREDRENVNIFERRKYQGRRKSLEELALSPPDLGECFKGKQLRVEERRKIEKKREKRERDERFHEGFNEKEEKEWVRGMDKRQIDRRKGTEELQMRVEDDANRTSIPKPNEYANFQEIHFKKFDRVVSNQFGKYPEFLTQETPFDFISEEKKVTENYDKVCQVSMMVKELKKSEGNFENYGVVPEHFHDNGRRQNLLDLNGQVKDSSEIIDSEECKERKKSTEIDRQSLIISPKVSHKFGKVLVERTKSDPYNSNKIQRRSILMHQKSIDLSQQSEEVISDYGSDDVFNKTSRSEHDIPYVLHKRHCMNGTARNGDFAVTKKDLKMTLNPKLTKVGQKEGKSEKATSDDGKTLNDDIPKPVFKDVSLPKQKPSSVRVADAKKAGVQIINLDVKSNKPQANFVDSKKLVKNVKAPSPKKPLLSESLTSGSKSVVRKDTKKVESADSARSVTSKVQKSSNISVEVSSKSTKEPIYAEVTREEIVVEDLSPREKNIPPEPPKRTTSVSQKPVNEGNVVDSEKKKFEKDLPPLKSPISERGEPQNYIQEDTITELPDVTGERKNVKHLQNKTIEGGKDGRTRKNVDQKVSGDTVKAPAGTWRGKPDLSSVLQRREESLILFARTRLGMSEGSAFTPIVRQGHVGSPTTQRRTRSLDSPYVSVHSLPPADAFSSKDDTVDGNEGDIVNSAVARIKEFCRSDSEKISVDKNYKSQTAVEHPASTESEVDSVFMDDIEIDNNFKKSVENQSKVEISVPEERILDSVRSKRLLSKIESVDFIDSEGDMDSSKQTEPVPIPSDRLVNLPESIRFPSVRQISGQTSEESADGWDQREVKVKRRTPRRSVGREEQDTGTKESVVWDSKDDEPPDDQVVWDDTFVHARKYEGSVVNVGLPVEYLKRGSCGQSIDDDNLSTPMKESSPEHWVSVDDLPEALEREEKLLRQQENILREKILNEKLKRELNLDTIDVDERYGSSKESLRQQRYEDDLINLKETFKGHSLDTYELNEKKLRERGGNKHSSLDEHLLGDKPISSYVTIDAKERVYYEDSLKTSNYQEGVDYIQCKVVNDVAEIDQFADNDEELEEFFVVLDENLRIEKDGEHLLWDEDDALRGTVSSEELIISVPEQFKDVDKEVEDVEFRDDGIDENMSIRKVEIRLSKVQERAEKSERYKESNNLSLQEKLELHMGLESYEEESKLNSEESRPGISGDVDRLSPYDGSRRGSEEYRKLSLSEDTGRLSPYDNSSRRSSVDPRRLSASDDAGRLSPFNDSRRGSEDPRRLSTSEDSRKYSASESASEETRRRLSSTEETRRKRASLTKQCSVGAESLSDEIISGIQECSSSFEQDEEKDVFEVEPSTAKGDAETGHSFSSEVRKGERILLDFKQVPPEKCQAVPNHFEIEVSEDVSSGHEVTGSKSPEGETVGVSEVAHLAPPTSERELSRETEDSVDYGEGDFKDIREVVKERDISEGLICDNESLKADAQKWQGSFEKSESSEGDELRYIDEKRGSTPEILMGKSKEAVAMSVVVVNEGISVLNRIAEKDQMLKAVVKTQSLPRKGAVVEVEDESYVNEKRHTLPKANLMSKPKPLTPKPVVDAAHRKLLKTMTSSKMRATSSTTSDKPCKESLSVLKTSLDSSQESDIDKLSDLSLISHVQTQIARRNLSDTGKCLRRDDYDSLEKENIERKTSSEEDGLVFSQRTSSEEREKTESSSFELKSSADELGLDEGGKRKGIKGEKRLGLKSGVEASKVKRESGFGVFKEKRSPEQEKRDSGEDGSSSSSAPVHPKRELSSTWKPFLLESSGSSSLEEGWLPPDENAHLADEEETSSTSNNQQDDSYHEDIDYPTGIGYPVLNMSSAEMMVGGYGSVYALSRTLSRISERSTSEQERSDMEDDITKPSSHSVSVEEESILSSDHQPSLSSDPPSPKESTSRIPDLPVDRPSSPQCFVMPEDKKSAYEPFGDIIPPPVPEDDWPSPPSSSSVVDTPVISHIETFYIEIHPEEARKVVVAPEPQNEEETDSDENQTLQEEKTSLDTKENIILSSTPLQNGNVNGELSKGEEGELPKSPCLSPLKPRTNNSSEESSIRFDTVFRDQNSHEEKESHTKELDSKSTMDNNRNALDVGTGETEAKKKRYSTDKGYFIIKELLSTERTYKKDLDVVNVWFHEEVSKREEEMPDDVLNGLFNLFDPLSAAHSQFLTELEQRLATWEGKSNILPKRDEKKIGDIILTHFSALPLYVKYLDKHLLVLERLDAAFRKNKKFEQLYRDFELQRVCYLPLSSFIMKPLQRLLHYNSLLKRLIKHYGPEHLDYKDLLSAQNKLAPIVENVPATLKVSENFIQLSELQRDMPGFEGLLQGGREFIRQGCLLKHSKKGFQQRMFFLFSDILVYTNRITTPSLQFKVNGQMPLRGVMVEESEDRIGTNFSFTIYGGNRIMTVAASSQEEKDKWLQDLFEAVQNARERNDGKMLQYLSLKSCSSSDEIMDKIGEDGNANRNKNSQQRSNTTVHVCWHRNASTCLQDHLRAFENGLSGFLLRKFKNCNGWQKLWVVFTNFCLFFYKTYLDESPLASLPLLGYTVTVPDDDDDIRKDYVFKLQFKNHVYFFRAESDYTFSRWMEVISSATKDSSKTKNLTYKDSS